MTLTMCAQRKRRPFDAEWRAGIGRTLREARKSAGLGLEQVAIRLDVTRQSVVQWETGKAFPAPEHLSRLIDLYGISAESLLKRDGRVAERRPTYPSHETGAPVELAMTTVPIVGAVSAGGLVEAWQEDLGTLEVPSRIVREAPRAFGLRVYGNSLASEWIYEGAIVVVDPDAGFIDGKIYAVMVDGGEVAARRVFEAGPSMKLMTGDGRVDEYARDRVNILGRVRWSFREH